MTAGNSRSQSASLLLRLAFPSRRLVLLLAIAIAIPLTLATAVAATPLSEYHQKIRQAVSMLGTMEQADEDEDDSAYERRRMETLASLRVLLREKDTVEWKDATVNIDNRWLHETLARYEKAEPAEREALLKDTAERLRAIGERLAEAEQPGAGLTSSKSEDHRKLTEILQRSEYGPKVDRGSALGRLLRRFLRWLVSFIPKFSSGVSPGRARIIGQGAQVFVVVLAVAVLGFVLSWFLPRFLRSKRPKKKERAQARILLGETLEPDRTAVDLIAEAEALARRGELRAAIRKGYIALLVELGDRKVISLAQHKTNHDYLRALREVEPLHRNVQQLTVSFERHWYGLAPASEADWQTFRSGYRQALSR